MSHHPRYIWKLKPENLLMWAVGRKASLGISALSGQDEAWLAEDLKRAGWRRGGPCMSQAQVRTVLFNKSSFKMPDTPGLCP
jgi:hypothetical protein